MSRPDLTPAQARELVALYETGKAPRPLTFRRLQQLGFIERDGWTLNKAGRQEAGRLSEQLRGRG